jgi:DNA-directed RNA polymerase specialized sigma24 family protein
MREILMPTNFMDTRFAIVEPSERLESEWDYDRDVVPHFERLDPATKDIVELYFHRGLTQKHIAELFGVSQPNVHQRLVRACNRIRLLQSLPVLSEAQVYRDLQGLLSRKQARLFYLVTSLHSQSRAAAVLGGRTRTVAKRWTRIRTRVEATTEPKLEPYRRLTAAVPRRKTKHGT